MAGPINCYEKFGSRKTDCDETPTGDTHITTTWSVEGTNDELEARNTLLAFAPPFYYDSIANRDLSRLSHSVEQVGFQMWECECNYSVNKAPSVTYSFDTSGATAHITQSRGTRGYSCDGSTPADNNGAIGVTKEAVEGCDVPIPSLKFNETHQIDARLITPSWINTVAMLTGSTNQGAWRIWADGQVLFHGATGQSQDDGFVPVTFSFEVGLNATGLNVAGASVEKKAWEYLWCYYQTARIPPLRR